ncbi:hypothetical protein F5H01DRAFT_129260 [Linnemannia elongata]|nr:hypothetical protein F5H01DRAFT_129260 [Linnemannia elongata]
MRLLFLSPWYGWMSWMGNGCVCKCDVCKRHCYCYKPWHRHYFFFFPFNSLYSPHLVIHGQCSHEIETRQGKRKRKKNGVVPRCCRLYRSEPCCSSVRCTTGVWVNKKEEERVDR